MSADDVTSSTPNERHLKAVPTEAVPAAGTKIARPSATDVEMARTCVAAAMHALLDDVMDDVEAADDRMDSDEYFRLRSSILAVVRDLHYAGRYLEAAAKEGASS